MIRKFEVENFKNFRDKITINLTSTKNYGFNESLIYNGVVNKALIYGKNASGKTNLGLAIFDIQFVLTESSRNLLPLDAYKDFINAEQIKETATFSYEFQFANTIVNYNYQKKSIDELTYEELIIDGKPIIKYNFDNHKKTINVPQAETLNFEFKHNKMSVVKYIANNSNLSKDHPIIKLMKFVEGMLWFNSFQDNSLFGYRGGAEVLSEEIYKEDKLLDLENFFKSCGLNYKLDFLDYDNKKILAFNYGNSKINFFRNASSGTRDLIWFYFWKRLFDNVTFLFIDEFDAYYHYELSLEIIKLLIKFEKVQTLVTTHNTYLITNNIMRPDCYFIINGSTINNLPQLTIKELREAHNLEKMYRSGEFD